MNRLVLIGNGFDLAHGLRTKYEHFMDWYWNEWGKRLLCGHKETESDDLCSFTLKDHVKFNSWSWRYQRQNPFEPWNPNDVIKVAKEDKDLCEFKYIGHFLERICQSISTKRWVDIENDYYALLERRVAPINGYSEKDIQFLNMQLDVLRSKLIDYLKQEQEKGTDIIDAIKDKIYKPIKVEEMSVEFKRQLDKSTLGDVEPFATMLLNFNYTQTPEKYITGSSKVRINYIHGKTDVPNNIATDKNIIEIKEYEI